MLKLGAETEITWGLSSVSIFWRQNRILGASEMSVSYKDSLNVFITKYIQTMHIHNINPRSSDMIKFNYRSFNFFQRIENR